jgi:hypothetical protein
MITTPTADALPTLDIDFLASVSGGCHKKCGSPQPIIINNNNSAPAAAAAAVPQAPAAAPPPPMDAGPQVSTSVSINGQTTTA